MERNGVARYRDKAVDMGESEKVSQLGHLAPEEAVLDAMGAYEALARHALMESRSDGLTKTQTDILMRLACCGKCSMSGLADDLAVSKEHITRAVNALIERGLVDKHRSSENYRLVKATLTEEGQKLSQLIRIASIERVNQRLKTISPSDRATLLQASEQAAAIIHKILLA